jgi:outer membrane protein TolC
MSHRLDRTHLATLCVTLALSGCAQLDPDAAFREVQTSVTQRAGQQIVWRRDDASRAEAARLSADLLRAPVGVDNAVRLALLNNAALQAAFAELGGAEADAAQASLLNNPFLHAGVQTPRDGGRNALDFAVTWDVLGLFTLPLRQEAAAHGRAIARLKAAARSLELAADTRAAWYDLLAARESADLLADMREASELAAEIARRLSAAGNQAGLARANAEAARLQTAYNHADAQARAELARQRLLGLIGLASASLPDSLPRLPGSDPAAPDADELEARHLDLAVLKAELARAEKLAAVADRNAWGDSLELGWDWSRESDGAWKSGPSLGLGLPLFDTGAARRAAAGFELQRLQASLAARRASLLREAGAAAADMKRARARVESLRETLLPLLSDAQDSALLEYNAMQRDVTQLLDLKQRELAAVQQLVQSLNDYWQARTALEALRLGVSLSHPASNRAASASFAAKPDGGH